MSDMLRGGNYATALARWERRMARLSAGEPDPDITAPFPYPTSREEVAANLEAALGADRKKADRRGR